MENNIYLENKLWYIIKCKRAAHLIKIEKKSLKKSKCVMISNDQFLYRKKNNITISEFLLGNSN